MTIPFTYTVRFKPTGQYYYGYRGRKGCDPSDLWTTYFTSSKIVAELIRIHGPDSFEPRVRKIFSTAIDAQKWERKVLQKLDARNNKSLLNQSNGGRGFRLASHSEESRKKISTSRTGITFSDEHKKNIGIAARGRITSLHTKEKISIALRGKVVSQETKSKLSVAASNRKHTAETKHKLSVLQAGKKLSREILERRPSNKKCMIHGVEYISVSEAARVLDIGHGTITYRLRIGKEGYEYSLTELHSPDTP